MAGLDQLLKLLVARNASDLHLSANTKARFRLNGKIEVVEETKELPGDVIFKAFEAIMPERNKKEFTERNDTDFAYAIEGLARFRVNIFRDHKGVGGVFRVIPDKILSVEQLKLPPSLLKFCDMSKGLILVTGPTGSGKSTTLAALIDYINDRRDDHIITIEDPIEFVHQNKKCLVNQREVHRHTDSFQSALRAALREDPDIVLVGELRDLETTEIAIETAETGHVVFGTLHTNSAIGTVDRIVGQYSADKQSQIRMMLADTLKGVITQNLLRTKDGKGRVCALEMLYVTPAIANNIREGKNHQIPSAMQAGKKFGMMMMNESILQFVKDGVVTPEEAYLKSGDKDDMANKLKAGGFKFEEELSATPKPIIKPFGQKPAAPQQKAPAQQQAPIKKPS